MMSDQNLSSGSQPWMEPCETWTQLSRRLTIKKGSVGSRIPTTGDALIGSSLKSSVLEDADNPPRVKIASKRMT